VAGKGREGMQACFCHHYHSMLRVSSRSCPDPDLMLRCKPMLFAPENAHAHAQDLEMLNSMHPECFLPFVPLSYHNPQTPSIAHVNPSSSFLLNKWIGWLLLSRWQDSRLPRSSSRRRWSCCFRCLMCLELCFKVVYRRRRLRMWVSFHCPK
jgi:hypothetical protein